MTPANTLLQPKPPVGLVLCSVVLLLIGLAILVPGVLFVVAPESLRDAGFGQGLPLGRRLLGLLFFGGVGALFAWQALGLITFRPFALDITRALAVAFAGLSIVRLYRGEASPAFEWPVVVVSLAMAVYLILPSVSALFRPPRT